mmetsp:Transcript_14375/g.33087  ORF Transcript_14375/g.33087 Transcript_14375/m.33087 type:complete len:211 (-) Transcript_14375:433-1065(-)
MCLRDGVEVVDSCSWDALTDLVPQRHGDNFAAENDELERLEEPQVNVGCRKHCLEEGGSEKHSSDPILSNKLWEFLHVVDRRIRHDMKFLTFEQRPQHLPDEEDVARLSLDGRRAVRVRLKAPCVRKDSTAMGTADPFGFACGARRVDDVSQAVPCELAEDDRKRMRRKLLFPYIPEHKRRNLLEEGLAGQVLGRGENRSRTRVSHDHLN